MSDRTSLYELASGEPFRQFIADERLMMAAHYVRKAGNKAAHTGSVSKREAFFSLLNIYNLVGGVLKKLQVVDDFAPFDKTLIPQAATIHIVPNPVVTATPELTEHADIEAAASNEPVEARPIDMTEAETRRLFIDMLLSEAGWEVLSAHGLIAPSKACVEIEVEGMPNNAGVGYADYVLFGANGKPLAVVEAKRTSIDPVQGRHQAELYADALAQKYGVRPVIYCSNGYKTEIIDGLGYPVRQVYGFHKADELELLIQQRGRKPMTDLGIKDYISNRDYQKRAIRKVCDRLNQKQRRSLLVMATGTGKTRVAISLSEVLTRLLWVKNVLFLADRTALVNQAAKHFANLLPEHSICVLNEDKKPDMSARIMLSTYPTMMGKIDSDNKKFDIGRFDLIIVDEAHRSVFGKYTAIFSYFDAFLVGLTATPRDEIDRNTFDLFGTDAEDAFVYELDEAVTDGFLVPYTAMKRGTKILNNGIKYDSLTPQEKQELEPVWQYEKAQKALDPTTHYTRDIENKEIFKYIFNKSTIDLMLQDLMTAGLKVESGDKIGKTIIFAYNHHHAELIVERFGALYPELGAEFCVLIDNYVNYAQNLIDRFEVRGGMPQIAVSVDMMDTGIDVVDILNLVFFKPVYSKIKFEQMIGRGTRLSEGIFGAGKDKTEFYIFDWCGNFEFFSLNPDGTDAKVSVSLSERLFCMKTDVAAELQHATWQADAFGKQLHDELKKGLHTEVTQLRDCIIAVRENWALVDRFRKPESWTCLSAVDVAALKDTIAPLILKIKDNEEAKKFDLLMFTIELSLLDTEKRADRAKACVTRMAQALQEKASIPQVKAKMDTIKEVCTKTFWENISLGRLERVRIELRELIKFLTGEAGKTFVINIEDEVIEMGKAETFVPTSYKTRVIDFLKEHRDLPVIEKIANIEQLTHDDIDELERVMWQELGTKQEYARYVAENHMLCGDSVAAFIRSQIGIDHKVAIARFSQFLSGHTLNADQEDYLRSIIDYVCQNGDITPETIINVSPFSELDWQQAFGDQLMSVGLFVRSLHDAIIA